MRLKPFAVEGSCGHKFNVIIPVSLHKYLYPELLHKHLSGEICQTLCPSCNKQVVFYLGFFIDTLEERIGIFPTKWASRDLDTKGYDVVIFEEYGKPFENLKKYLLKKNIIDETGTLSEEYVPKTFLEMMRTELGIWEPKRKKQKEIEKKEE